MNAKPRRSRPTGDLDGFKNSFQVLQASLSVPLADMKRPRVMVTSPDAGAGKTMTCVNLAFGWARAGLRVVLVDLDLRHPNLHDWVGGGNDLGVTSVLGEQRGWEECLQMAFVPAAGDGSGAGTTPGHGDGSVAFLAAGPAVDNPAELLRLDHCADMLDQVGAQSDLMVIDAPPVLSVADALIVGRLVSGVVLVAQARRTTLPDLARANDVLLRNQTSVFGVVLNRFDGRDRGYWELPGDRAGVPGPLI